MVSTYAEQANIKMQKTGANSVAYAKVLARF
jgi:hypothetical protein